MTSPRPSPEEAKTAEPLTAEFKAEDSKAEDPKDAGSKTEPPRMMVLREFFSVAIVVAMLCFLAWAFIRDQLAMHHGETPLIVDVKTTTGAWEKICGPNTRDGHPTAITMLYSDDKQAWIERAAQEFSKLCPNVQVKLKAMDDVSSADAIVADVEHPNLWAPADDLVLHYLDARWKKEHPDRKALFRVEDQITLAASPLVLLIWHERAQVMRRILDTRGLKYGPWVEANCAQVPIEPVLEGMVIADMVPGTWIDWYNPVPPPPPPPPPDPKKAQKAPTQKEPVVVVEVEDPRAVYRPPFPSVEKMRSWGRVKFVHTSPTRSAVGLESVYLMAYDYLLPLSTHSDEAKKFEQSVMGDPAQRGKVVPLDLLKKDFDNRFQDPVLRTKLQNWLRRCEAGLDPAPKSSRLLTETFFHVGSSRFDAVVTYEHLVFDIFKQVDDHGGALAAMEVIYPSPTLMNQHPLVVVEPDKLSSEEKIVAEKWIAFLRSEAIQKEAVDFGFRPINSKVIIREYDSEDNPFLKYRRYGIDFESPILEPPRLESAAIADIVRLWQDATGRN